MNRPFHDLLVIELASVLAGPSVGMFFAELGARVLKIENPTLGGDVTRGWKLVSEKNSDDVSAYFSSVNWGKESLALDIQHPDGLNVLYDLIRRADIVLVSYKPGDAIKLKVDYPTLQKLRPQLIYAEITAYGEDDPRAGYDAILQAETGFMHINGLPGPENEPLKMPVALIDVLAGHQLKEGILVALFEKYKTGKGQKISISLYESAVASLVNQATNWLVAGQNPQRMGSEHPNISPYGKIFYCLKKAPIVLAIGSDKHFQSLCRVLKIEHIGKDSEFRSNNSRVRNREKLNQLLQNNIKNWSRKDLLRELHSLAVPAGAIQDIQQVFSSQKGKTMILQDENTDMQGVRSTVFLSNLSKTTPPPKLNQHQTQILGALLGYDSNKIKNLIQNNVTLNNEH